MRTQKPFGWLLPQRLQSIRHFLHYLEEICDFELRDVDEKLIAQYPLQFLRIDGRSGQFGPSAARVRSHQLAEPEQLVIGRTHTVDLHQQLRQAFPAAKEVVAALGRTALHVVRLDLDEGQVEQAGIAEKQSSLRLQFVHAGEFRVFACFFLLSNFFFVGRVQFFVFFGWLLEEWFLALTLCTAITVILNPAEESGDMASFWLLHPIKPHLPLHTLHGNGRTLLPNRPIFPLNYDPAGRFPRWREVLCVHPAVRSSLVVRETLLDASQVGILRLGLPAGTH